MNKCSISVTDCDIIRGMGKSINVPIPVNDNEVEQNTIRHDSARLVAGKNGGTLTPFNSDTAKLAVQARERKKHEVMMRALNREVQPELIAEFGEYAYMAEGAVNMQRLATSPEAGKAAVMAFESIMEHTGHGKRKDTATDAANVAGEAALRIIAAFAAAIPAEVIEAHAEDMD